jgi:hypothetical protein
MTASTEKNCEILDKTLLDEKQYSADVCTDMKQELV